MPHRFSGSFWLFLEIIGKDFHVTPIYSSTAAMFDR